jgi:hypothetical protein
MHTGAVGHTPEDKGKKSSFGNRKGWQPIEIKGAVEIEIGNPDFVLLLCKAAKMTGKIQAFQKKLPKLLVLGLLLFLGEYPRAKAQALLVADKVALDSMKKAIDLIYNFQFERAENCIKKWRQPNAQHPAFILFNSLFSFWKKFPIGAKPNDYQTDIKNLNQLVLQAHKLEKKYPNHPEPEFYLLLGNLILARHQSEEGDYIKSVNSARKAYTYIKSGFLQKADYPDFYFSTGLYNYYRVAFPENHPLYKPFTVFFPDGSKATGLKELEIATQKSVFSRAEAFGFLSTIYLRDEFNVPMALKFATQLHILYPDNWLYGIIYAECLLESRKTEAAEEIIERLLARSEMASLLGGYYLKGLSDTKKGNPDAAKWAFQKALQYAKSKDRPTKGYVSLCYLEMGKIAHEEGKRDWARKYFKLALENSSFRKVKTEISKLGY